IKLPNINYKLSSFDFIKHREYTIKQLILIKNKVFKDTQKNLIRSLIDFFEQYNRSAQGGEIHIKINYFDKIWEEMVGKYLNDHFEKVDENRSEEHTSELQSRFDLVCRLLLEKKN